MLYSEVYQYPHMPCVCVGGLKVHLQTAKTAEIYPSLHSYRLRGKKEETQIECVLCQFDLGQRQPRADSPRAIEQLMESNSI